ncbi:MAG TPA: LysM peptidoglycan-binding domain-containing protein [Tepidisphaeraceae bacterium]|jgi:phage tail protein X
MTRETKIGLLVGLAFIIVIGILLSDHINSSTDPARAEMTQTADAIGRSVASPDLRNQGITTVVTPPHAVIPQTPVPTSREPLPANNGGSSVVVIGPGADPSSLPRPSRAAVGEPQPNGGGAQILSPGNAEVATNDNPGSNAPTASDNTPVAAGPLGPIARQNGEELVPVPASSGQARLNPQPATSGNPAAPARPALPPGVRQVKAEEGDTVTKLAIKYMGGNSKANREAIIRANPNTGPDGRRVFAGQTYLIPAPAAASASPAAGPVVVSSDQLQPAAPRPAAPKAAPAPEPVPSGMTLYTVKENESLWKIASEQLGSGARYTEIRDLNQDVLKGSDAVRVGMRLKLPPKALASSN